MKYIYTFIIISFSICAGNTTQWTVSNDPLLPAQFSTIQSAIDSVSNGDTLIIAGSATNYAGFTLNNKGLTFIGEGIANPDGYNTRISGNVILSRLNINLSSSNSTFEGIRFSSNITVSGIFSGGNNAEYIIENLVFDRCEIASSVSYQSSGTYLNHSFINCLFYSTSSNLYFYSGSQIYQDINFENCVFSQSIIYGSNQNFKNELLLKNCLFLDKTSNIFSSVDSIILENCIFYKAEPTGATNSTFTNCQTYICNSNTIPYGSNSGTGNLINTNPIFNNYPELGGPFSWAYNFGLKVGSASAGSGSGGTDIGLTGGNHPLPQLKRNSQLPVVTSISLPNSSVPLNGILQGSIQAKVRN